MRLDVSNVTSIPVGAIECAFVSDGSAAYPPDVVFANVSAGDRASLGERWLSDDGHVVTPYSCLLIRAPDGLLLVDTGLGAFAEAFGAPAGKLQESLRAAGVAPEDVDLVVVTHGHPDHIGGLAVDGKPAFRRARHYVSRLESEFWSAEDTRPRLPEMFAEAMLAAWRSQVPPLREAGVVELVEGETELLPGVNLLPAPGHTPGHMAVEVSSQGEALLYLADTVTHELQLERPEWLSVVDVLPEVTVETRRGLLDRAVEQGSNVAAFHVGTAGRVEATDGGYRFRAE